MNKLNLASLCILFIGSAGLYAAKEGEIEVMETKMMTVEQMPKEVKSATYYMIMNKPATKGMVWIRWHKLSKSDIEKVKERLASLDKNQVVDQQLIDKVKANKGPGHKLAVKVLKNHEGKTLGEVLDMLKMKLEEMKSKVHKHVKMAKGPIKPLAPIEVDEDTIEMVEPLA